MLLQDIAPWGRIEVRVAQLTSGTLRKMTSKRLLIGLGTLSAIALLAVGLVQLAGAPSSVATTKLSRLSQAQVRLRLAGSPAPLALLHDQANQLLNGGRTALHARLASLRGHPVVINKWASWCAPCRSEVALFQHASADLGRRVAFIGIDSGDASRADAGAFLRSHPLSYPSYYDPSEQLGTEVTDSSLQPVTVFYRSSGRQEYIRQGPYMSLSKLEADIERYAIGS